MTTKITLWLFFAAVESFTNNALPISWSTTLVVQFLYQCICIDAYAFIGIFASRVYI